MAVSLLTLSACSKSGSGSSSSTSSLNSTESQLIGTWYLQKEVDSSGMPGIVSATGDTTYTGYNNSYYQTFNSNQFGSTTTGGGANWKQETESWTLNLVPPVLSAAPGNATGYWFFDNTTNYLTIVQWQYSIVTLTGSQLVLKQAYSTGYNYYYFTK